MSFMSASGEREVTVMAGFSMGGDGMCQAECDARCISADARAAREELKRKVSEKRGVAEMADKKYVVPPGMLEAAIRATKHFTGCRPISEYEDPDPRVITNQITFKLALGAAVQWLAENPVGPNMQQALELQKISMGICSSYESLEPTAASESAVAVEWQRRMLLAPDPTVPEEIKDMLLAEVEPSRESYFHPATFNEKIKEAFRRGQDSPEAVNKL